MSSITLFLVVFAVLMVLDAILILWHLGSGEVPARTPATMAITLALNIGWAAWALWLLLVVLP